MIPFFDQVSFFVSSVTGNEHATAKKRKTPEVEGARAEREEEMVESEDAEGDGANEPRNVTPGISIWVAFNCPPCYIARVENTIIQVVQSSGLSPTSCKVCDLVIC